MEKTTFLFRLSMNEKIKIKTLAKSQGLTMSKYLRTKALES